MSQNLSFSQRLKQGWTREQLIKYYAMTEAQYMKVLDSLKAIQMQGTKTQ